MEMDNARDEGHETAADDMARVSPIAQSTPRVTNDTFNEREAHNIRWERELLQRERALFEQERRLAQQTQTTTTAPVYVMNATVHATPEFNPSGKTSLTAVQWVKKMEGLARTYKWDDECLFQHAIDKLKGAARRWFEGEPELNDWEELKAKLIENFPTCTDDSDIHYELSTKKMKGNETYEEYVYDMRAVASKGNVTTQSLIKYIINGITDRELARNLALQPFSTILEMLTRIKQYEGMFYTDNKFHVPGKRHSNDERKHDKFSFKCYNCQEEGHKSVDCPKPQKRPRCTKCQRTGHDEGKCPMPKQNDAPKTPNVRNIANEINKPNSKDEFHKEAFIDGKRINVFIDLGSDVVTMKVKDADRLNIDYEPYVAKLRGFGNGISHTLGRRSLLMRIDNVLIKTEVLIVPNDAQEEEMIVGKNAFDVPNIRITKEVGKLRIETVRLDTDKSQDTEETTSEVRRVHRIRREDVHVNEGLDQKTSQKVITLVNDYSDCFADDLVNVGTTDLVKFNLELTKEEPVRSQPYRLPYPKREKVGKMINDLLEAGIIRESTSDYASPVMLVAKKTGDDRLCVDYRKLNTITKREQIPMPRVDEVIDNLSGSNVFTTLDLANGYYQILVEEESKPKTAFVTTDAQYEFNRLPFGVVNGPSVFSRLMAKLQTMVPKETFAYYMDDIVVASRDNEENLTKLRILFETIRKTGLTFKLKKCAFLEDRIDFLGYEVSEKGIRPGKTKTNAVENFTRPENVHGVRQFLGLTGFFRKFVEKYSIIARPLTILTRQDQPFEWGESQEEAFQELKRKLTTRPILEIYRRDYETEVHTDASKLGIAGILLQRHDKRLKPIAYFSRQTTELEAKYHSYELEALAVVDSLERFRIYVLGKPVIVVTDCNSLKTLTTRTELNPRIGRWSLKLQEYDLILEHRAGTSMLHVDALSRNTDEPAIEPDIAGMVMNVSISESDWLLTMQLQDDSLRRIRDALTKPPTTNDERQIHRDYTIHENRVCRKVGEKRHWVVPKAVIPRVIRSSHDDMGHYGLDKTVDHLQRYVWFAKMRKRVKNYIASCIECTYHKLAGGRLEGRMYNIPRVAIPFHTLNMDHLGPFLKSARGNSYVLACIDNFTKYILLKAVKNTKSRPVCAFLEETSKIFGCPVRIITDRGTAFTAKSFKDYCDDNQIQHIRNATATPRANGQVERLNRTLLTAITTMNDDKEGKNWDKRIKDIQFSINCMKNNTTGRSPHELLFDYNPRNALKNRIVLALTTDGEDEHEETLVERRQEALEKIEETQIKQKERFDRQRKLPRSYREGDLVLVRREAVATGQSRKLEPKYKGPYLVKKILGNDRYLLIDIPGAERTQRSFESVYSSDRIKLWCVPDEDDDESSDHDEENSDHDDPDSPEPDPGGAEKTNHDEDVEERQNSRAVSDISERPESALVARGGRERERTLRRRNRPGYLNDYVL